MDAVVAAAEQALAAEDPWLGLEGFFVAHASSCRPPTAACASSRFAGRHGRERVARARARLEPLIAELVDARAGRPGELRDDVAPTTCRSSRRCSAQVIDIARERQSRPLAPLPRDRARRAAHAARRPDAAARAARSSTASSRRCMQSWRPPRAARPRDRLTSRAAFLARGRGKCRCGEELIGRAGGGKTASISRPPPARARTASAARGRAAMAWAMESPSPGPAARLTAPATSASRWNGRRAARSRPAGRPARCWRPRGSHRRRRARRDLDAAAGDVVADGVVDEVRDQALAQARVARDRRGVEARVDAQVASFGPLRGGRAGPRASTAARSNGSWWSRPRWLRESVSSASISRSCCSPAASTRAQRLAQRSTVASGSASATSTSVRSSVSGVRSSCEALATNWRWASNEASRRSSRPLNVFPSCLSSSSGPSSASRRCRLLAEMSRAAS